MVGLTKPLASALLQNLSHSTYGWKDKPSHLRVPWSKIKVLLPTGGRTNQATSKCLSTKFKSFYLRVEGRTKSQVSWSKFKSFYLRVEGQTKSLTSVLVEISVLLSMGGRMNQVTYGCLGQSLKSYCLQVEGRTKPPTSAFVQNSSPSTYGWKDEPSHQQLTWYKI